MNRPDRAVAFDFDGTLVDSAPGILRSLSYALECKGINPLVRLDRGLVGPPLPEIIGRITGKHDPAQLQEILDVFMHSYDRDGCLDAPAFPGMHETLSTLQLAGRRLYLVTNKRGAPTRKMLGQLRWTSLFETIYCLDEHIECESKERLLAKMLDASGIRADETPYVGDMASDARAAGMNAMPYIHALWGYGEPPASGSCRVCDVPAALLTMLGLDGNFPRA